MNKKNVIQFKTIKQIEAFLTKKDCWGTLDNIWENITDEFSYEDEAETCVSEFNNAIKRLKKLVSK
jgi:ABC-type enterochelin transport system substrate-binding protein